MIKKEEKAHEYVKKLFKNGIIDSSKEYDNICNGFENGWDEALKNLWISAKEKRPETYKDVFIILVKNEKIKVVKAIYIGKGLWIYGDVMNIKNDDIIAWMPIPSFDEILETNKDVLKRLKDK